MSFNLCRSSAEVAKVHQQCCITVLVKSVCYTFNALLYSIIMCIVNHKRKQCEPSLRLQDGDILPLTGSQPACGVSNIQCLVRDYGL